MRFAFKNKTETRSSTILCTLIKNVFRGLDPDASRDCVPKLSLKKSKKPLSVNDVNLVFSENEFRMCAIGLRPSVKFNSCATRRLWIKAVAMQCVRATRPEMKLLNQRGNYQLDCARCSKRTWGSAADLRQPNIVSEI